MRANCCFHPAFRYQMLSPKNKNNKYSRGWTLEILSFLSRTRSWTSEIALEKIDVNISSHPSQGFLGVSRAQSTVGEWDPSKRAASWCVNSGRQVALETITTMSKTRRHPGLTVLPTSNRERRVFDAGTMETSTPEMHLYRNRHKKEPNGLLGVHELSCLPLGAPPRRRLSRSTCELSSSNAGSGVENLELPEVQLKRHSYGGVECAHGTTVLDNGVLTTSLCTTEL